MKLSTRARYALRAMIKIARESSQANPISLEKVAAATDISRRYLEQLAIALKSASLLRSVSGRRGGYFLHRPADEIKIGEIVEAAIGKINVVDCVELPDTCMKAYGCECRLVYQLINKYIRDVLHKFSLADLCNRGRLEAIGEELGSDMSGFEWSKINAGNHDLSCPDPPTSLDQS